MLDDGRARRAATGPGRNPGRGELAQSHAGEGMGAEGSGAAGVDASSEVSGGGGRAVGEGGEAGGAVGGEVGVRGVAVLFEKVTFRYASRDVPALEDMSFEVCKTWLGLALGLGPGLGLGLGPGLGLGLVQG